jgi:hypothetical protein
MASADYLLETVLRNQTTSNWFYYLLFDSVLIISMEKQHFKIEEHILDTNAGKQMSEAATDV